MKQSGEKGFVILMVLGIAAALFLVLGTLLDTQYQLRRQNAQDARSLQQRAALLGR